MPDRQSDKRRAKPGQPSALSDAPDSGQRQPTNNNQRRHTASRAIATTVAIIIAVPLIVLLLTFFVFQQYQVDGISMKPTLQNANRLIVWKAPRTWAKITGHPYIPNRGNIIIFHENNLNDLTKSGSEVLIKRVIGLPGDHIVIKNGQLTIYDQQHPAGFQPRKTLPYGKKIPKITSGNINITVPPDQVFVCGDNRPKSLDSRIFGPVPVKNIIGKLILRITPLNEIKDF
ncbi:MAG: signal peptidase I [Candidatus Saccharimonadales bacterium]